MKYMNLPLATESLKLKSPVKVHWMRYHIFNFSFTWITIFIINDIVLMYNIWSASKPAFLKCFIQCTV
jgi:hypothetical protein